MGYSHTNLQGSVRRIVSRQSQLNYCRLYKGSAVVMLSSNFIFGSVLLTRPLFSKFSKYMLVFSPESYKGSV